MFPLIYFAHDCHSGNHKFKDYHYDNYINERSYYMITNDVSTLKIHKLTQEQYDRELAAGRLDENALYLTPDGDIEISDVVGLQSELDSKFNKNGGTVTGATTFNSTVKIGDAILSYDTNQAALVISFN